MSNIDYNEILLQSIQELIDASLRKFPTDSTEICAIVDNSDRENGHYKVTADGAIIYDAYSEKTTYTTNDSVVVLFPKNDTQKKTIISRYIEEEIGPVTFVSQKNQFVQASANFAAGGAAALEANGSELIAPIITIGAEQLKGMNMFNTIYLKADFQTRLEDYQITQGSYGLRVTARTKSGTIPIDFVLDSQMMFGNPYAFISPFSQESLFRYISDEELDELELSLYQTNNFKYFDGKTDAQLVPSNLIGGFENIKVSNIELYFGYDVASVEDNTVKIYSAIKKYTCSKNNSGLFTDVEIPVSLVWYNKTEDNKYLGFESGSIFNKTLAQKLRATISSRRERESDGKQYYAYTLTGIAGSWQEEKSENPTYEVGDTVYYTLESDGSLSTITGITDEKIYYWIEWYSTNKNGVLDIVASNGQQKDIHILGRPGWPKVSAYAIIYCNGQKFTSNTLEFDNAGAAIQSAIDLQGIEAQIVHGANSQSSYQFYDSLTNRLFTPGEANRERALEVMFSAKPGYAIPEDLLKSATYKWILPSGNTMIAPPREEDKLNEKTLIYRINENYFAGCQNNTIKCEVTVKGADGALGSVVAEISLGFATFGASGTDYTIIFVDKQDTIEVRVVDKNAVEVAQAPLQWKWRGRESSKWAKVNGNIISIGSVNRNKYNMLEVKAQVTHANNSVWIYGYYAIASPRRSAIIPGSIIYDSTGTNPMYYQGDWSLIDVNSSYKWRIVYYDKAGDITTESDYALPTIENSKLKVPTLYTRTDNNIAIEAVNGDSVLYNYPIYIGQNQYESALLNNWDGALKLDKEGNYILAAMLGAGHKNSDNTFTGVVMGDYAKLESNNTFVNQKTGLFGFSEGKQTFEFNTNGTASLGQPGQGQIIFDGTEGIIKSSGWKKNANKKWDLDPNIATTGTLIDLDNAALRLEGGSSNSYIRFNQDDDGKLEMKLALADIKLADQEDAKESLGTYIQLTSEAITAQAVRKATYMCTCSTPDSSSRKYIRLYGDDFAEVKKKGVADGVILNITFSDPNTKAEGLQFQLANHDTSEPLSILKAVSPGIVWKANETLAFVYDKKNDVFKPTSISMSQLEITADGITSTVSSGLQYFGTCGDGSGTQHKTVTATTPFILRHGVTINVTFTHGNEGDGNYPRYLNVSETGNKPIYTLESDGKTWSHKLGSRPAGAMISFCYNATEDVEGGSWRETKNGAFSKIQQTADSITLSVNSLAADTSSKFTQTAQKINAKVSSAGGKNGFEWSLVDTGFSLQSTVNGAETTVFNCTNKGLTIKPGTFTLKATDTNNNSNKVILSTTPGETDNYYFYVGRSGNNQPHISFKDDGKLDIVAHSFSLTSGGQLGGVNQNLLKNASLYTKDNPNTYKAPSAAARYNYTNMIAKIQQGQKYTLSFEHEGVERCYVVCLQGEGDDAPWEDGYADHLQGGSTPPYTFTIPEHSTNPYTHVRIRFDTAEKQGAVYKAWNIKLEEGEQATSWVSDLNFDNSQGIYLANGKLNINANSITSGTIAADRIDVANLEVKKLDGATGTFKGKLSAASGSFINLEATDGQSGYIQLGLVRLYGHSSALLRVRDVNNAVFAGISCAGITANGNIDAESGTISCQKLTTSGNIDATSGTISCASLKIAGHTGQWYNTGSSSSPFWVFGYK